MRNLFRRTITGVFCIVLIVGAILAGQQLFALLFLFVTIIGLWEFYSLMESSSIVPNKMAGTLIGAFIFVSNALIALGIASFQLLFCSVLLLFMIFLLELYRNMSSPFINIAYTFFGILYVVVPLSLLNYFPNPSFSEGIHNMQFLLGFFILVWVNETFAYIVGTTLGKTKLFKSLSPNKTWEGMIGGGIFALLASWIISNYYTDIGFVNWFVIALIIVVFGTYGDLFESLLKRSTNKKDSGSILPGHGGILDRFDGVLIAAPFVFVYLHII